jgi:uncharacterized protein
MPYLIDGHNLIPKINGLHLSDPDDEARLIEILAAFSRRDAKSLEVYFDGASPGLAGRKSHGRVRAYFIQQGQTADNAIIQRLHKLGGDARNWVVVSSDHQVQQAARHAGARVLRSEAFSAMIEEVENQSTTVSSDSRSQGQDEIEEWLRIFGDDKN